MNDMQHDFGFQSGFTPLPGGLPPPRFPRIAPLVFSGQPKLADSVIGFQKCPRPIIVPKDPKQDSTSGSYHLGRHPHDSVKKPTELHLEQFLPPRPELYR